MGKREGILDYVRMCVGRTLPISLYCAFGIVEKLPDKQSLHTANKMASDWVLGCRWQTDDKLN